MVIRRPTHSEYKAINALIGHVVTEVYGSLWGTSTEPVGRDDWSRGWIAVGRAEPVGVLLTTDECIDDLWIASAQRGHGLGAQLLSLGETEIAGRSYEVARLRVLKANVRAISFYFDHGWKIEREFQHEHLPVTMLQMEKRLGNKSGHTELHEGRARRSK
jgi:ribosomal protein S18 acetylase RimI-like enzyme